MATADHQCEAYDGNDDIRDLWERARGLTVRGRATDFWNRYREDIDLAKRLDCTAFRLSLSWARLEPQAGVWDDEAFAHYRDLLEYLRASGIRAIVTLHHNTWPLHVQAAGNGAGLLDVGFPARLEAYATRVAARLGDLIDSYVTINEPNQLVYGFIKGFWMRAYPMPPGLPPSATPEMQMDAVLTLIPNLLRAHTQARAAIHAQYPNAKVGANPLVLGLPRWLQNIVDRLATHAKSPAQLRRHAARIGQQTFTERGAVDLAIAQLTMTHARMEHVLFSQAYFTTQLSALHATATVLPEQLLNWKADVGVINATQVVNSVDGSFTDAIVHFYAVLPTALAALRRGEIALIFHDAAMLQTYATVGFALTPMPGTASHYAVATALGHHSVLDAIDRGINAYRAAHPTLGDTHTRDTLHALGNDGTTDTAAYKHDGALAAIRKRGVLRVGIHPGVDGLCMRRSPFETRAPFDTRHFDSLRSLSIAPQGDRVPFEGLEIDLAVAIAKEMLQTEHPRIEFVPLQLNERLRATRSWLCVFDGLRRSWAMFGTMVGTNWWNLAMQGKLPEFLCPPECVGALDFVGLDYYWGVPSIWQMQRLAAASECRYSQAPVWPGVLEHVLNEAHEQFPDKPIIVIENGCVTSADGFSRAKYLEAHVAEVDRAIARGVPVEAYLCWSITSNREWGLPFDDNSDFGLYHIDLDTDPQLKRTPTEASARYAKIIEEHRIAP